MQIETRGKGLYDFTREIEKWLEQFKALMAKRFTQLDDVLTRLKARKK